MTAQRHLRDSLNFTLTNIVRSTAFEGGHVNLVSSSISDEGKTTTFKFELGNVEQAQAVWRIVKSHRMILGKKLSSAGCNNFIYFRVEMS